MCKVYVLSPDAPWLAKVAQIEVEGLVIHPIPCSDDLRTCIERLPPADPKALLLIDRMLPGDLGQGVTLARQKGWRRVVAIGAAAYFSDMRAAHQAGAEDYWTKCDCGVSGIVHHLRAWLKGNRSIQDADAEGARERAYGSAS